MTTPTTPTTPIRRTVCVAHPSAELYGSDLQLVETVRALTDRAWTVHVHLPQDGWLAPLLAAAGARVDVRPFPVLRRSLLTPQGAAIYARDALRAYRDVRAHLRATRPDVVLVNTITIPQWLAAARTRSVPSVCHVHEAEETAGRAVRMALALPTGLASVVVVNSQASLDALAEVVPAVRARARLVHNGVRGPEGGPDRAEPEGRTEGQDRRELRPGTADHGRGEPSRLVVVGRLSPRKGTDVALEATALLAASGHDVHLDLCGSTFTGYQWFEDELRARAARPDLSGRVTFHGYVNPTWPWLARAHVVLVPSRQEPFGNTAVEAMLAGRPVVVSAVQGLLEIVDDHVNGLLAPPGDAGALADAVASLLDDPAFADRLAAAGAETAATRFSPERYAEDMVAAVEEAAATGLRTRR